MGHGHHPHDLDDIGQDQGATLAAEIEGQQIAPTVPHVTSATAAKARVNPARDRAP
jgi:hypothetical protein